MTKQEKDIVDNMLRAIVKNPKKCSQPDGNPGNGVEFYLRTGDVCEEIRKGLDKLKALGN